VEQNLTGIKGKEVLTRKNKTGDKDGDVHHCYSELKLQSKRCFCQQRRWLC